MRGSPLLKRPAAHSRAQLLSLVDTIASMHNTFSTFPSEQASTRRDRLVSEPIDAIVNFRRSRRVEEVCKRVATVFTPERVNAIPTMPQHGDLYPGNVLVEGSTFHFIDWDRFAEIDLPMHDFVTLMISILDPLGTTPQKWTGSIPWLPTLQRRYAETVGLSAAITADLLPLSLINAFYCAWREGRLKAAERAYEIFDSYCCCEQQWVQSFFGLK